MSATKIGKNSTNILKLLVFMINLHFVTSNQISTYRKLKLSLTGSIYFVFLPLEMLKETRTDQSISRVFLLYLKRIDPQTFKRSSCKNSFFQCICYCYNLLRWMFLFFMITGRHCFSCSLSLLWDFLKRHVAAFFEASVLKEVRILCVISTITIPKFQKKADYIS